MNKKYIKASKFMSLVLRHNPSAANIELDPYGWAHVWELIISMNIKGFEVNLDILNEIVETNDKKRFVLSEDGTKIRAAQGHTIKITHNFLKQSPPDVLYHGTPTKNRESILKYGINKGQRHHVHLSDWMATAIKVAQRRSSDITIFMVSTKEMEKDGIEFFISDNGVWLTHFVDPKYLQVVDHKGALK